MKRILITMSVLGILFLSACEPKKGTVEDKEAVKKDSVDAREGKGEGEVGDRVYGR